jgi:hypothetical protein
MSSGLDPRKKYALQNRNKNLPIHLKHNVTHHSGKAWHDWDINLEANPVRTYPTYGKEDPNMIALIPRNDSEDHSFGNYDSRLQYAGIKGTDNPMLASTMPVAPNGSVRGVLPCKGNTASGTFGTRILRTEPVPSSGGMVVPQGFAKSQQRGLASDKTKPLNVKPMMERKFFNVEIFNPKSTAKFVISKA